MTEILRELLEPLVGEVVCGLSPVSGGDINQAHRLTLADGRKLFVKSNPASPPGMFTAEARGLGWLAQARAIKLPEVIAVSEEPRWPCLVLEYLEPGRPRRDHDERLGRGLAALHRFGADTFGHDEDNFIGSLPQANASSANWASFYRERRLSPLLARACDRGLLPTAIARRFERLLERLESLVGPAEPPARLHGDLWGGNLYTMADGEPALIDPAVYGGHREMDLAMMKLFGGFGPRVFAAYHEAYPLAEGQLERVALYQLYPLLVHVNLFGSGYLGQLERALGVYV